MQCPNCGSALSQGDEFCGNCGFDLKPTLPSQKQAHGFHAAPTVLASNTLGNPYDKILGDLKMDALILSDDRGDEAWETAPWLHARELSKKPEVVTRDCGDYIDNGTVFKIERNFSSSSAYYLLKGELNEFTLQTVITFNPSSKMSGNVYGVLHVILSSGEIEDVGVKPHLSGGNYAEIKISARHQHITCRIQDGPSWYSGADWDLLNPLGLKIPSSAPFTLGIVSMHDKCVLFVNMKHIHTCYWPNQLLPIALAISVYDYANVSLSHTRVWVP